MTSRIAAVGVERPYRLHRMVLCLCGACRREHPDEPLDYERDVLQGVLVEEEGAIWLRRRCRRGHGEVVSLYEERADLWRELQEWRVPTKWIEPDQPDDARPIPMGYLGGLGALQEQHTCVLVLDVTEDCNIACPICFAGSHPGRSRYAPVDRLLASVDAALEREGGRLELVMLSGGEPTLHPRLEAILDGLLARQVTRVVLNTNGIRVAHDDALLRVLQDRRRRVETYLQFDGPDARASMELRGADLVATHEQALRRLTGARVFTTLACTVAAGVNDADLGHVIRTALETDYVGGVVFQPVFGAEASVVDPLRRVTTTGLIARLDAQCNGALKASDFVALPCSHPDCTALTYLVKADGGAWRSLPDLVGRDRMREHLGLAGNRLLPDDALWEALTGLLSGSMSVSREELVEHLAAISGACRLDVGGLIRMVGRSVLDRRDAVEQAALRVKRISVKGFMDAWTLNVERLRQCCVHVATIPADGPSVRIPFCARNTLPALYERANEGLVETATTRRP
jgi:uncharacterized radical SAM superfamily Fe-S cluster-containing enzyme